MTAEENKEYVFKIVILGESAVGKTSLINMYVEKTFERDYKPTLGANIIRKDVNIDNFKVRLILWDLAGQEKYNVIRSMYFQGCAGCMLVYDVTRPQTFEYVTSKWLKDFQDYVKKKAAYVLIGNKTDLADQRIITTEDGKNLAEKIEASDFIETSALKGENVEKAFVNLVRKIFKNYEER